MQHDLWLDRFILLFLHRQATPLLDRVMLIVTLFGARWSMLVADAVVLLLLTARQQWASALFWVLATGGAGLIELVSKPAFGRIRPDLWPSIAP